jgi:hypothetical protein
MSLVPTWVEAQDGWFYKNPMLTGTLGDGVSRSAWFICFDDDELSEIVLATHSKDSPILVTRAKMVLSKLGVKYVLNERPSFSGRLFPPYIQGEATFIDAVAFHFELWSRIPIPQVYDERSAKRPTGDCGIYEFET